MPTSPLPPPPLLENLEENERIKADLNPTPIDEPKTPYHAPVPADDEVGSGDEAGRGVSPLEAGSEGARVFEVALAAERSRGRTASSASGRSTSNGTRASTRSDDDGGGSAGGSLGDEAAESKRRRFEARRRAHYNMGAALRAAQAAEEEAAAAAAQRNGGGGEGGGGPPPALNGNGHA